MSLMGWRNIRGRGESENEGLPAPRVYGYRRRDESAKSAVDIGNRGSAVHRPRAGWPPERDFTANCMDFPARLTDIRFVFGCVWMCR